jgi:hypothetical protein
MTEIIAILLSSSSIITTLITVLVSRRSNRIDDDGKQDNVFSGRIDYLEKTIENVQKFSCFRQDCKDRVK